jgi:hypothetical protein
LISYRSRSRSASQRDLAFVILGQARFQQIALVGRRPLQLDCCGGNLDTRYRSNFYWHLKLMDY